MSTNYFEDIKRIVVEKLQVDEKQVTPEASFMEDLGADSLDTNPQCGRLCVSTAWGQCC